MDQKRILRKFDSIVAKIRQKRADIRTIESWIVAMDMLQELFGNQRFFDFSMGEERWKLMMNYMEQVIAGKAGEIPERLVERFAFAKAISTKISFRSTLVQLNIGCSRSVKSTNGQSY
uniref:Uncharacterized protein LOC113795197 n=1 Tax=Dermatophagoides pteronyssinus TaxID=6956 RepID=A0A6P6Y7A9_DERPT|nr:uncharacterized protein LOC113795197 [Dermatophagoides pteronyssinus]